MTTPQTPELHTYRELSCGAQLAINQFLIWCVREDCYFNIKMIGDAKPHNLVKIKSINFGYSTIDVVFKTITDELIDLPIDLLLSIEIAGDKEI